MIALVFDTETTGLTKHPSAKMEMQPKIIEFAGVLVREQEIVGELEMILDPGEKIEPLITKITGLTDEDLLGKPTFRDVEPAIYEFFSSADTLVAHNLPFDSTLIDLEIARLNDVRKTDRWSWSRWEMICTVQEHAEEFGYRPKLTELYSEYFGEKLDQKHRALDDVKALARIWMAMNDPSFTRAQ